MAKNTLSPKGTVILLKCTKSSCEILLGDLDLISHCCTDGSIKVRVILLACVSFKITFIV